MTAQQQIKDPPVRFIQGGTGDVLIKERLTESYCNERFTSNFKFLI